MLTIKEGNIPAKGGDKAEGDGMRPAFAKATARSTLRCEMRDAFPFVFTIIFAFV